MYEVPFEQSLQRQLLLDASFADQLVDWGQLPRAPDGSFSNVQDGYVARNHPELGRVRAPGELARLGFAMYADDVEVVNPIGFARVKHKVTLFYVTVLNQKPHIRSHLDNIYLVAVVLAKDMATAGPHKVLHGSSHHGDDEEYNSTNPEEKQANFSFGATMRKFARPEGISFTLPNWEGTGFRTVRYRAFLLLLSADTLAAADLIGTKKSFSPTVFRSCWQCYCKGQLTPFTPRATSYAYAALETFVLDLITTVRRLRDAVFIEVCDEDT